MKCSTKLKNEKLTLKCPGDYTELDVWDFFRLVSRLYEDLGFVNDIDIIVNPNKKNPTVVPIRPDFKDEDFV